MRDTKLLGGISLHAFMCWRRMLYDVVVRVVIASVIDCAGASCPEFGGIV